MMKTTWHWILPWFESYIIHTEPKVNVITYAKVISIHLEENILWHLTAFELCVACSEIATRKKPQNVHLGNGWKPQKYLEMKVFSSHVYVHMKTSRGGQNSHFAWITYQVILLVFTEHTWISYQQHHFLWRGEVNLCFLGAFSVFWTIAGSCGCL